MVPCMTAMSEVLWFRPHVALFEITTVGTGPGKLVERFLLDEYEVFHFVVSPESLGWPCRRDRRYMWCARKRYAKFRGSEVEFHKLFGRSVSTAANIFWRQNAVVRLVSMAARAAKHGNSFRSDTHGHGHICVCDQLTFLAQERYHEFISEMTNSDSYGPLCDSYTFDVGQNLSFCSPGRLLPPITTKSQMVNSALDCMMEPVEMLLAMGEAVPSLGPFDDVPFCWGVTLDRYAQDVKSGSAPTKRWAGNSMHLAVVGSLLLYCMARTQRYDTAAPGSDSE